MGLFSALSEKKPGGPDFRATKAPFAPGSRCRAVSRKIGEEFGGCLIAEVPQAGAIVVGNKGVEIRRGVWHGRDSGDGRAVAVGSRDARRDRR
jgi:hypothetical protein